MVDRDAPYSGLASIMAMNGRYGDTELVHMSKPEIRGLASLGELTINPETGLPEAFNLKSLLPVIGGIAGSFLLPGIGTALGTSLFSGIGGGMIASGLGTFAGGILGGQNFGEAALGGIMGGITSGSVKGLSGLMSGAESVGADAITNAATDAVADTAVSTAATEGANLVSAGIDGGSLTPSVFDGISAAYPAPTVPSSGFFDWMSDNPGKTAAIGAGGLGVAGLLAGGDEQYPEEEPQEIEKLPQFTLKGADPIDREYTEEGLLDLYTRGAAGDPEREKRFNYFTPPEYELRPSELNTGGLVGLDDNQGASQSSGVGNFLQPKQGNNNVDPEKDIFNSMYNFGASAGKADEEKGVQSLVSPVDVVAPPENTGRLRLELLGGGKHRYVRDAPLVVEEPAKIIPVPDTIEELSDNADTDTDAGDQADPADAPPEDEESDAQGPAAATGGLISMLKKAEGGIVSLAGGGLLRETYPEASSIIKKWESVRQSGKPHLTAYQDDANNWTIGFGKNLGKKKPLDKQGNLLTWTSEQAEADHEDQLKGVLKDIKSLEKKSGYTFNSKQINGLIPLIQNIGLNQLIKSKAGKKTKALKALEKGNIETFFDETYGDKGFINVNGKKAMGLVNRRAEEGSLFNNPLPRPKVKPEPPKQQARPRPKVKPEPPEQQVVAEDLISRSGVMQYPRTAKDTSYKGGIEGLEGGKLLEKIREYIPFSEGGTLEQYYQGQVIGKGDGMSDEILFDVEGRNPDMALLSRDEYVIPADVVSMIGNGSSNAGAEELDGFLKNVRQQSFGTRKQQREMTNPQKGLSALV